MIIPTTSEKRTREFRSRFSRTLLISVLVHTFLLLGLIVAPSLPGNKTVQHDIHRVNLVSLPLALQQKLPVSQAPVAPPPSVKTAPPEIKKAIPKPKKETTPKPVPAKRDEATTIKKTQAEPDPAGEKFSMDAGQEGMQRAGAMMLDTAYFPYTYFLKAIRDKIARNWFPPFGVVAKGQTMTIMIYFKIEKSGSVLDPEIEESSGNALLDQSALRAVLVSNPFPPLPFGFVDERLGIHFRFECSH